MRIYVDYDDCLCETARSYSMLAAEMFGRNVPYEHIRSFDLFKSFGLNQDQYERFMLRGHQPEVLLSLEETPGASAVINEWIACGHEVTIITGRPFTKHGPLIVFRKKDGCPIITIIIFPDERALFLLNISSFLF